MSLEDAEDMYLLYSKTKGENHPETAGAIVFVGQALAEKGRYDEAFPMMEKGIAIIDATAGPISDLAISVRLSVANGYFKAGRTMEALEHYRAATRDFRTLAENAAAASSAGATGPRMLDTIVWAAGETRRTA